MTRATRTIKKWVTDLNKEFSKEKTQMDNKHPKKFSASFIIKEIEIKTLRLYFMPVRMVKFNRTNNRACW